MNFWINFWAATLILVAGGFALLAIVVAFGGARDVRKLCAALREEHEQAASNEDAP